ASGSGVDRDETPCLVEDSSATTESGEETVSFTVSSFPLTNCCDDSPSLEESLLRDPSVKSCDLSLKPVSSELNAMIASESDQDVMSTGRDSCPSFDIASSDDSLSGDLCASDTVNVVVPSDRVTADVATAVCILSVPAAAIDRASNTLPVLVTVNESDSLRACMRNMPITSDMSMLPVPRLLSTLDESELATASPSIVSLSSSVVSVPEDSGELKSIPVFNCTERINSESSPESCPLNGLSPFDDLSGKVYCAISDVDPFLLSGKSILDQEWLPCWKTGVSDDHSSSMPDMFANSPKIFVDSSELLCSQHSTRKSNCCFRDIRNDIVLALKRAKKPNVRMKPRNLFVRRCLDWREILSWIDLSSCAFFVGSAGAGLNRERSDIVCMNLRASPLSTRPGIRSDQSLVAVLAFLLSILGCNLFDMSIASTDSPSQISSDSFSLCRVPDPICGDLERPLMCHGVSSLPTLIPLQVISVPAYTLTFSEMSSDLPTLFFRLCLSQMI
ncbi:MAG: hypothetical protein AAGM67_08620, partial [Bacteroidota bacterium]